MIEPNSDQVAIVQPAQFADRLTGLMVEAQGIGRKTHQDKIALGHKLLEAHAEWERRCADGNKTPWPKAIKPFGFSKSTALRLMTAARFHDWSKLNHQLLKSQPFDADVIYDDGFDPDLAEGKKPCRPCRIKNKAYDDKCSACKALNRPVKEPKEDDGPLKDEDGNLVPEHLVAVFAEGQLLRELGAYLTNATKAITGLMERPGCSGLKVEEAQRRLKGVKTYLWKFRPGYVHLECEGKGCDGCRNGWRTVAEVEFERAQIAAAKNKEKAKVWRNRKLANNTPIPE